VGAPDDDQELVEFVAVNGAMVDPPAAPDALAVAPHGPSRRIRLLALGTLTLVAAGLVVAAAHHGHGSPSADGVNPPAASGAATAASAVPHALHTFARPVPTGIPVGRLSVPAQARLEQRRVAGQLEQERISALTGLSPVRPNHLPGCPATTGRCTVIVGSMPAPALAAVRAQIPDAKPVRDLEVSGIDDRGALYFRQLRVKSRGCVITLQLAAGPAGGTGAGGGSGGGTGESGALGGDVVVYTGSGRLTAAQHPAPDGFVASFRLTGKARACPSDSALRAIAADSRLLVAG
jgi:hypothetical protein